MMQKTRIEYLISKSRGDGCRRPCFHYAFFACFFISAISTFIVFITILQAYLHKASKFNMRIILCCNRVPYIMCLRYFCANATVLQNVTKQLKAANHIESVARTKNISAEHRIISSDTVLLDNIVHILIASAREIN